MITLKEFFIKRNERLKAYAPVLLRISLALVFLWFGINQLIDAQSFLGYVPQWLQAHSAQIQHEHAFQFLHEIPLLKAHLVIMINGVFETLLGLFLAMGLFTRVTSLLLSIHLFGIALSLGYNDLMIRDLGLALATFSVFLSGADWLCLDTKLSRNRNKFKNIHH